MGKALVSIVIPIYNVERFLPRCIESVLQQSYRNLEIILVDDGSTDGSGKIADEAAAADRRVVVVHKENGGLSDARNVGICAANGQYITFIDGDDYISSDYVKDLLELLERHNAQISVVALKRTGQWQDKTQLEAPDEICYSRQEAIREMLYACKFSTSACAKMYPIWVFRQVRFPVGKFSEDMFTTYKLLDQVDRVAYSSQIDYYYYCRAGSIVLSGFSPKHMDVVEGLLQLQKDLPLQKYGLEKAFASQMVECIAAMLGRKPDGKTFREMGLWNLLCKYRGVVWRDRSAAKRVRGYSLISYLGLPVTIWALSTYYRLKWKSQ